MVEGAVRLAHYGCVPMPVSQSMSDGAARPARRGRGGALIRRLLGLALIGVLWGCSPAILTLPSVPLSDPAVPAPSPATLAPTATLPPVPTSPPSPTAPPSPTPTPVPLFSLAWFHKPPEDGTTAALLAAAHGYIHLTGPTDAPFRDSLRAAGYTGPVFTYLGALTVGGPGPYNDASAACAADFDAWDNTVAWSAGDFCTYIHPHESWFLHNGKGERIYDDYFGNGHWGYLMNPADPGWRAFYDGRMQQARATWGYDGVYLDNLDFDLDRARLDMQNSDGQVREYATDEAWRAAVVGWLAGLRAAVGSWQLWANLFSRDITETGWDAYAPYLDGAMDESFAVSWLDKWRAPDVWAAELARAAHWQAQGKDLVLVGQGAREDTARLDFTLASYLLVAQPGQAFYRYTRYDSYYSAFWSFPEYATARQLGVPVGPRTEIRPGVWRRDFTAGYVEADATAHTGRLVLNTP
jgi:hypothetical protein